VVAILDQTFRDQWGRVLAALIGFLGDIDLAEEATGGDRQPRSRDYRYLHSTRGEMLRRLGRIDEAREAYDRALALVDDDAERRLLERRLAEL
jgi:predicted RNA polymerase sigma factor